MKYLRSKDNSSPAGREEVVPVDATLLVSTYGLIIVAAAMLSVVERNLYYSAGAALFCGIHVLVVGIHWKRHLSRTAANFIALGIFTFSGLERWLLGTPMLISMGHFLLAVLFIKLYERNTLSSFRLIQIGSVLLVTLAAASTDSFSFFPVFIVAVVMLIWNFIACELARHRMPEGVREPPSSGAQTWGVPTTAVAVFFTTAILFVIFPRVGSRNVSWGERTKPVVGYSDSLSLQDMGRLFENDQRVMEVKFTAGGTEEVIRPTQMLMRGRSLETYWEGSWYDCRRRWAWRSEKGRRLQSVLSFDPPRRYLLNDADVEQNYVDQEVWLDPLDTNVLFALYRPVEVEADRPATVQFDRFAHALLSRNARRGQVHYWVRSMRPDIPPEKLRQAGAAKIGHTRRQCYLEIPEAITKKLDEISARIQREYNPQTVYEHVQAVMGYLRDANRFDYSLQVPATGVTDPVLAFLTRTKQGNCQHFASAMALLLRKWEIPTRLAIGFSQGDYQSSEQTWVFRQNDAHAWVEVCFEKYGWVTFDPTPAGSSSTTNGSAVDSETGILMSVRNAVRRLKRFWTDRVVDYGFDYQRNFLLQLYDAVAALPQRIMQAISGLVRGIRNANPGLIMGFFSALVILVGTFYLAWPWLKKAFRRRRGRRGSQVWFYNRLLATLERKGLKRPAHLTPWEFADLAVRRLATRIEEPGTIAESIRRLTRRFYAVKYGNRQLDSREKAKMKTLLVRVKECPKLKPSTGES